MSEWIQPLSEHARNLLISKFLPEDQQEEAKENPANKICLAHIKLGLTLSLRDPPWGENAELADIFQEATDEAEEDGPFTLRDISLNHAEMTDLGLPIRTYATYMGIALATLHRELQLDGAGVRFVLGGPREAGSEGSRAWQSLQLGNHRVWMTHLHRCRHAKANMNGLRMWKEAYWSNEGYFPRRENQILWHFFEVAYLRETRRIAVRRGVSAAAMMFWRETARWFIYVACRRGGEADEELFLWGADMG